MMMHKLAKRLFTALRLKELTKEAVGMFSVKPDVRQEQDAQQLLRELMAPELRCQVPNLRDVDIANFAQAAVAMGQSLAETLRLMRFYHDYYPRELKLPRPKAGPGPVDGSEVHYLKWEPPTTEVATLTSPTGVPGFSFKLQLDRRFYQKPDKPVLRLSSGYEFTEDDCTFVGVEPNPGVETHVSRLRITVPFSETEQVDVWFSDEPSTWAYFPTIAKQLGRVNE